MLISEEEKNRILKLHQGNKTEYLTEDDKSKKVNVLVKTFFAGLTNVDKEFSDKLWACAKENAKVEKIELDPSSGPIPSVTQVTPTSTVQGTLHEEPEKDTYWMITKANRDNLINMGGTAEEIGKSATNDFSKYCK